MALLNIFTVALVLAGYLRVDAVNMCQVCINAPTDLTLAAGNRLFFDTFIENQEDKLCPDDAKTIKATAALIVRASLQVLVQNPTNCYFSFYFGNTVSPVGCLVSGNNITGGHYTQGSCEAMGKLGVNDELIVKVGAAQGSWPCILRSNSFICLSALEIPAPAAAAGAT